MSTERLVPDDPIGKYLTAFADGELGTAESLEVLEYLKANPDAFTSAPDAPHPVLMRRGGGLGYHLVADDAGTADAALPAVPTAPEVRKA